MGEREKKIVLLIKQHNTKVSCCYFTCWNDGKKTKATSTVRFPNEKARAKVVLDSSNKTKRKGNRVTSLDLLGSLLQMFGLVSQAWFHGFKQEIKI